MTARGTHGRCPMCGGRQATWGPQAIIAAVQAWHAEHGEPPKAQDWRSSSPTFPSSTTCRNVFGTWNETIRQAGFKPRVGHAPSRWTREGVIQAIFEFRYAHGRLPSWREWSEVGAGRPTSHQIQRLFGSWNAGIVAAGYEHEARGARGRSRTGYQRQAGATTRNRVAA